MLARKHDHLWSLSSRIDTRCLEINMGCREVIMGNAPWLCCLNPTSFMLWAMPRSYHACVVCKDYLQLYCIASFVFFFYRVIVVYIGSLVMGRGSSMLWSIIYGSHNDQVRRLACYNVVFYIHILLVDKGKSWVPYTLGTEFAVNINVC